MDVLTLCLGALVIYLVCYIAKSPKKHSKLPPGPKGLPVFGNIFALIKEPAQKLFEWSKIYGPIFTIYVGSKPMIIMNDFEIIKDFFKKKESTGRVNQGIINNINKGHGVVLSTGEIWSTSRKMLMQYLRDSGKNKMEQAIAKELKNVINHLKKVADEKSTIELYHLMNQSAFNITSCLCFGKLFPYDDPTFIANIDRIGRIFNLFLVVQALAMFKPFISPFLYFTERVLVYNAIKFREYVQVVIDEHIEVFHNNKPEEIPADLMYTFLSSAKEEKMQLGENKLFSVKQLLELTSELFSAGTESISTTVRWFILFMLKNPKVKACMQNELDQVIGRSRLPTWLDRDNLPYTIACMQEVERQASVAHLALPHTCLEDLEYKGYIFPKGVEILYNVWGTHHDPKIWPNPRTFDPERFFDDNGKVVRPGHLISFGIGRRICPGEMLAKIEFFMYVTTLFHKFDFHEVPTHVKNISGIGLAREPHRYEVAITCRE